MSGTKRAFQAVSEEPVSTTDDAQKSTAAAMRFWLLGMEQWSNRAVVALSHLFTAAAVASAWALYMWTLPRPSTPQLVGLALYSLFLLAVEWVRRRKD